MHWSYIFLALTQWFKNISGYVASIVHIKSSPPEQKGHNFAGDIFRCIFVNEKFCILIQITPKFVP